VTLQRSEHTRTVKAMEMDVESQRQLTSLILHEVAGISALEAAIAAEDSPGYVVLFQDAKVDKQANIEQLATLIRMAGSVPSESAAFRQLVQKSQARLAEKVGGTAAALRTMRVSAKELLKSYGTAMSSGRGLVRTALEKAHGRTTVQVQTLTAHIAKLTSNAREAAGLPRALPEYFAGPEAKVCFRCHFDRPGTRQALELSGDRPYTYICAGCHDDAVNEFRPDLAAQMERWTQQAREARAIQHAIGRASKLTAAHTVIRKLCGLPETPPMALPTKPLVSPLPPPAPSPAETRGVIHADSSDPGDAEYVKLLFNPDRVRNSW